MCSGTHIGHFLSFSAEQWANEAFLCSEHLYHKRSAYTGRRAKHMHKQAHGSNQTYSNCTSTYKINANCCLLHSWHSNHSHCCCHVDNWDFHTVIKCSALLTKVWVITVSGRKFYSALTNYLSGKESMITLITALFLTQHVPLCYVLLLTGCICSPELKARHNYRPFCEYSK